MSPSPTFHSIPQRFSVTIATEFDGEVEPDIRDHTLEPDSADEHGICLTIEKGLRTGYPLLLTLVPSNITEGTLTLGAPDDFPFTVEVGRNPPSQIHIHRNFAEGTTHITCLIPLTSSAHYVDIEHARQQIWDLAGETDEDNDDDMADDEDQMEAADDDADDDYVEDTGYQDDLALATYYGALMLDYQILALDYTPGVSTKHDHFHNIQTMQRHFLNT